MTRDSAEARWISWCEASQITGIPAPTIEHAGRAGRIARRESHGRWPTLDRASVLKWAESYKQQKAAAEKRGKSRPKARKTSKRIVRPFRETLDEDWLTTSEAAEILGTAEDTVRRMASSGELTSRREGRWLVHRDAVTAHIAEEARWITWVEAARLIDAPRHVVELWIRDGRLRTRQAPRAKPSVERLSAEALAIEWRAIVTEREAKRRARQSQEA